jgi:ParB/RepB/Spo0J family partition protein
MATATATPKKTSAPPSNGQVQQAYPEQVIDLKDISDNSAQSRGMGALGNLQSLGWGLFEKIAAEPDRLPLWNMLLSEDSTVRAQACGLIVEHECGTEENPGIIAAAASQKEKGQLQPIVVVKLKDGTYDVQYGMQRAIARAYNWAMDPTKFPRTVLARIVPAEVMGKPAEARWKARDENRVRRAESPIDRALFFQEMKKEYGMSEKEIAEREDRSTQHIKDLLSLLDKRLETWRTAFHNGEKSVDWGVKKLRSLKEGTTPTENDPSSTKQRKRFPSVKSIQTAYSTGKKPKKMDDDLWEFYKDETVRKFIAKSLGFKFQPYKEPKPEPKVQDSNGETPAKKGKGKVYPITRKAANNLLICLGQTNAATWTDADVLSKLENIVNLGEPGMQLEDKLSQTWFDTLMAEYQNGYTLKIKPK